MSYLAPFASYRSVTVKLSPLCVQGHSNFKVTDFGTNRKPICDFLLVINTHIFTSYISPFPSYCRLLVKFALSTAEVAYLSLTHSFEALNSGLQNLASKKLETSLYRVVQNTFRYL